MKYTIVFILCLFVFQGFSQRNVNDYKYVIVPEQFGFQNEANQFRLNQLTKFLLKKYGFVAYTDGEEFPEDLARNNCLALKADVNVKGAFKTIATVKLLDCYNNLVFLSEEGVTKEKSYSKAYNLAIRKAFTSFDVLNYEYVKKENTEVVEIEDNGNKKEEINVEKESLEQEAKELPKQPLKSSSKVVIEETQAFLNAQPIANGYNLIHSISKQVDYTIYRADIENTYIIKDKSGVIFKKDNAWVRQYVAKQKTITEVLDIRF